MAAGDPLFRCDKCGYATERAGNWRRHLATPKHRENAVREGVVCGDCGKVYRHRSGLSRHRAKCPGPQQGALACTSVLERLVEQNGVIAEKLTELAKREVHDGPRMTLNIFLNGPCRNAMNLSDFVDGVQVTMSDLDYTRDNGYAEGMSRVFSRHLRGLEPTARPIHCTDAKRLTFYVKDQDKWERDDHEKLRGSIGKIARKHVVQVKEWERANPDWEATESGADAWAKMVREVTSCPQGSAETSVLRALSITTDVGAGMLADSS